MLAIILLALPVLFPKEVKKEENLDYFYGTIQKVSASILESAQNFEHESVILRAPPGATGIIGESKLFAKAQIQQSNESALMIVLRNQKEQALIDDREGEATINLVQLQTDQNKPFVLLTFGFVDEVDGKHPEAASLTRQFQEALL